MDEVLEEVLDSVRTVKGPTAVCPLCSTDGPLFDRVDRVDYFTCPECDLIFADPRVLAQIDAGEFIRDYDDSYWLRELQSARDRSYGSSLARVGEALLYCTIPVKRFIDIGTGPGYLLDALRAYLPSHSAVFHGVEKFPPEPDARSSHPNYHCADLADLADRRMTFECGVCVEVFEHLTPDMARAMAAALWKCTVPGSLFIFNTGLTDYVRNEDRGYLDPRQRGHILAWSVTAARRVFQPLGFVVHPLPGKTWAFVVERPHEHPREQLPLRDRIWSAEPANLGILRDPEMGEVMMVLGRESARAYG
ncbi:methyltransferase domain-containing protein [Stenotrophomonas sp. Sm3119]|uniref:methyltransferase domain-containing protein n=1 Tax=Stenotrophomonas sp. Sm3119 TaxID=3002744 RepID=UPI0027E51173|nr:methyltransferase domain-containing protein [Stenotrophomonas sp. Sm3119]MDQ7306850.1 methyltransferase domain-containing protein [Stenotrophomonas sp. Sm3119]